MKDGGPAFPATHYWNEKEMGYRPSSEGGMSLRDYFAAHAPAQKWSWYYPKMPARPEKPPADPVGNDGECPTDGQAKVLESWRQDPCWDVDEDEGFSVFSHWCGMWRLYWDAVYKWDKERERASDAQWPWFYADAILEARK